MKIVLSIAALMVLGAVPAGAQTMGGSLTPPTFQVLPWTPPANPKAVEVSGSDATYVPSTFVTFGGAVAAGKADLNVQAKTVAEAAAECRERAKKTIVKIRFAQDSRGNAVLGKNP